VRRSRNLRQNSPFPTTHLTMAPLTHEPDPPAADCTDGHTRLPAVNGWVGCRWCDECRPESDQPELSIYDLIYED
jgi:hypothetical protein